MTTNERHAIYRIEFFVASDAEESDPDTAFETTGDNTDDLECALAEFLNLPNDDDIRLTWLFNDNSADVYNVVSVDNDAVLGVAYISVDHVNVEVCER